MIFDNSVSQSFTHFLVTSSFNKVERPYYNFIAHKQTELTEVFLFAPNKCFLTALLKIETHVCNLSDKNYIKIGDWQQRGGGEEKLNAIAAVAWRLSWVEK